jgi:hypothetical protein
MLVSALRSRLEGRTLSSLFARLGGNRNVCPSAMWRFWPSDLRVLGGGDGARTHDLLTARQPQADFSVSMRVEQVR